MSRKKISRAAVRRTRIEHAERRNREPEPLPAELEKVLTGYRPQDLDPDQWERIQPLWLRILRFTELTGAESLRKHRYTLAYYLAWCEDSGLPLTVAETMKFDLIDQYMKRGLDQIQDKSRADYRSRLRTNAQHANPGPDAPRHQQIGYASVSQPYTRRQMLDIRFVALNQRSPAIRRQLCASVGLGRGGGLDAGDLRELYARDIDDRGVDGIVVTVHGRRPRTVVIRREWEDLVRIGIGGLRQNDLVLGKKRDRRNIVSRVVEEATVLGHTPHIEQPRLRSTWLVDLMTDHIPLTVILKAAGLQSARTLTDLLPHVDDIDGSHALRGEPTE